MSTQLSYSGMTTKIRALEGKLFTRRMYEELASMSSVNEFVGYLKSNTAYAPLFAQIDESTLHRGQIERLLMYGAFDDFSKIYRFSSAKQRAFLDEYFKSYEIIILKKCLRCVFNPDKSNIDLHSFNDFFTHHSKLNIPLLSTASTIDELVDYLKGSPYYTLLNRLRQQGMNTLFDYEIHLDLYYFGNMFKSLKKSVKDTTDLDILIRNYGLRIDLLNMQWIFRGKFNYHMNKSQLLSMVIPVNYKLKRRETAALLDASTVEEYTHILQSSYYNRRFKPNDITALDDMYDNILEATMEKDVRSHPYSAAILYSYLMRKEHEREKLTKILECIRYGLDSTAIMKYI